MGLGLALIVHTIRKYNQRAKFHFPVSLKGYIYPKPNSRVFIFPQGFDMFRGDKTLCDVVLIPGDSEETFLVHRVIMASSSDYFKAMFTGQSARGSERKTTKRKNTRGSD